MSDKSSKRLPVNPRRHKVAPERRKRVATACNNCNIRRIKCTGDSPCSQCLSSSKECIYPEPIAKVTVSKTELENLKMRAEAYKKALHEYVPQDDKLWELISQQNTPGTSSWSEQFTSPGEKEMTPLTVDEQPTFVVVEARLLNDGIGTARFQGETSELAFVDNLKAFLRSLLSPSELSDLPSTIGRCQASDSRPLSPSDGDALYMPLPNITKAMLNVLRSFIQDGSEEQTYPSGGLFWFGDLQSTPTIPTASGHIETDIRNARRLAFYQTALAAACHVASTNPSADATLSEKYFSRATSLLGNPLDVSHCSLGEVAVLTLMAYYLIETDRREAAHVYVCLAGRVAMSLGAHRGFVDERGKRIFWTLYVLDRWVSCLTGRPPSIPDDGIQLPLPVDSISMPAAAGLKAHIELSRISNHIVCRLHRVAPSKYTGSSVDMAMDMLNEWQLNLPAYLQLSSEGLSNDPGVCMLYMLSNQLTILILRPSLFEAIKTRSECLHIDTLIAAAERNMRLARHVATLYRPRRLLHTALHFVFNAALCYISQSLLRDAPASNREVEFAIELFKREAETGNTYGRSCAGALRELQVLVGKRKCKVEEEQRLERRTSWLSVVSDALDVGDLGESVSGDVMSWMEQDSIDWSTYDGGALR